jgi:DNA-binding transcriptional LysR family regulator
MNLKNINQVDLNLLLVFDVVATELNTVRAAEKLNISQPAVSHALNRLRDLFGDRLFVRASRGLIPTPRALSLQAGVREVLERAESLVFQAPSFDPATAVKTFRIATTDLFEHLVLPELLQLIEKKAPGITVISRPTPGDLPREKLEADEYDLAVAGFYGELPDRFFEQRLFQDDFVCVARKGVVEGKTELSLERYAELKHLIVSTHGDLQSRSREVMKKKGFEIHYVAGVTSFLSPARILAATDLVLTCPRRLAASFTEIFPLKIFELPFKMPHVHINQIWHERHQDDLAHQWLRQILREICVKI